jgi:hypothetical protein
MEGALKACLTAFRAVKSQVGAEIYSDLVRLFLGREGALDQKKKGGNSIAECRPFTKAITLSPALPPPALRLPRSPSPLPPLAPPSVRGPYRAAASLARPSPLRG